MIFSQLAQQRIEDNAIAIFGDCRLTKSDLKYYEQDFGI